MNVKYKYKMSFVMPVYNAGEYLDETISSVINQSIGFKKNIQLILVNDGSTDNSGDVAKKYQKKYPKNIIYLDQENQGVSAARNNGINLVEGKYISFLDSDDMLSKDTVESVYNFFEKNYDAIDVVAIKLEFFGSRSGPHILNYRFDETKVVDIKKDYSFVHLSGGSSFVKTETVKGKRKFDTGLKISEDAKFMTELILEKMAYGVVSEPTYWYRKNFSGSSAIDKSTTSRHWYFDTPKKAYLKIIQQSKELLGFVPRYVQYLIAYDLQWRVLQESQSILGDDDLLKYKNLLVDILQHIDDDIILEQKNIHSEHHIKLLSMKYGRDIMTEAHGIEGNYYIGETLFYSYDWGQTAVITSVDLESNRIKIEGYMLGILMPDVELGFRIGEDFYPVEMTERSFRKTKFLGEEIFSGNPFTVELGLFDGMILCPAIRLSNSKIKDIYLSASDISRLVRATGRSYRALGGYLLCWSGDKSLVFVKRTRLMHIYKELRLWLSMVRGVALRTAVAVIFMRTAYYLTKPFIARKKTWLISDRIEAAGDNGEAFFRYMSEQPERGIRRLFVISKLSPDFLRMKRYGRVIDPGSWLYRLYFLHADKVISSHADENVTNAFGKKFSYIASITRFDFIFLQHGITKDDISAWLNKNNKNIKLFVTAARNEKKSITLEGYGYNNHEVVLTGLPRYDLLKNGPKNKIIVAPTWRSSLAGDVNQKTGLREYNDLFKSTDYYKFYNGLLNNRKITSALEKYNFTLELYIHPSHSAQLKDFVTSSDRSIIKSYPYDYRTAFKEGSLLVTDYSSVAFDFAYLNKPVIYSQFDETEFFKGHIYNKGYFDYRRDGFGEVYTDYSSTEDAIVSYIKSGCKLKEEYKERIDEFYAWRDRNNSQRVYQAILNMDSGHIDDAIRKTARHYLYRWINRKEKPIKTFWYVFGWQSGSKVDPVWINFGDDLTRYIIWAIWGLKLDRSTPEYADLAGIGSIVGTIEDSAPDRSISVWGSGYIGDDETNIPNNYKVYALRGRSTLSRYGGDKNSVALGDPGLLSSLVFKKGKYSGKIGLVYHYADEKDDVFTSRAEDDRFLLIDPRQTPDKVIRDITSCSIVFSSGMHGLIVADSFGVPNYWMPVGDRLTGGDYKFIDYYSVTNREAQKVSSDILNDMDEIDRLRKLYRKIPNLKEIQKGLIKSFPFKRGYKNEQG